jgi:hypothetical protein
MLLRGEASPKLDIREQSLPDVAAPARRQDIFDEVRPSASQRNSVIRLEWSLGTAVGAAISVALQQGDPLLRGVVSFGCQLTGAPTRSDRLP